MLDYVTDGRDEYRAIVSRAFNGRWIGRILVREVGDTGDWYQITRRMFDTLDLAEAWGEWFLEHQGL